MSSDDDGGNSGTRSASPTAAGQTHTSEPVLATGLVAAAPPVAPQLRDPERYQILGEHGRGGLGRVSRAHDRELGRDIAIKELISRGHMSEVRFLREALITARLEHPGIVPVHEAGRWPDGTPFYAMKLVAGRSLRDLLLQRTTVDERIALLHHVIAVADAIAYAHGRHIIHRDLKPANVIVGDFGETIVIDWGLAKDLTKADDSSAGGGPSLANGDDDLTSAGAVLGTPAYMAPEQKRGEAVDQRADVFAIGTMLWELCSLQKLPPSDAGERHRMLRQAGIDHDLIAIIDNALDPDPARRYPDAGALAADLKAFKAGARIAARRYSLWAMLAHWTRRHRTLALSSAAVVAILIAGSVLYVRNISTERDRADAALQVSRRDLDRAQLAEASLLLEKDPTSARELLASLPQRSPQYALLSSRAQAGAATRVIPLPGRVSRLLRHPTTSELAIVTIDGALASIDADTGQLRSLDTDLLGPATSYQDGWLYSRRPFGSASVTVTSTTRPAHRSDAGSLLAGLTAELLTAGSRIYGLDGHDLYALDDERPALIKHGVHSIAGNDHLLLVCTTDHELDVVRDGAPERHTRCANTGGQRPMAVAGPGYAALLDADHLLLVRGGKSLELPTHISGGYELALSPAGLLAVADAGDKTWFVRPGSDRLELGPVHASLPTSVTADDRFAAWGYADGVVVAIDTRTSEVWQFKGHSTRVTGVTIDPGHAPGHVPGHAPGPARLISIAGTELRVWTLAPSPLAEVPGVPCTVYTLVPSPDRTRAGLDCFDGALRVWSLASGEIREIHRHRSVAFSVAWWGDHVCSGGFDGQVLCTSPDGTTRAILSSVAQIRWLESSPDHRTLVIATADGKLQAFDGTLRTLYAHGAPPYRMAFSPDGQLLASGADDGSVIVHDLAQRRIGSTLRAHTARVMSVVWRDRELWTAGADGTMLHWRYLNHALMLIERIQEVGSFRFLHLLKDGWSANINSRSLLVDLSTSPARSASPASSRVLRFDLGRHVAQIDVSPDDRYIAATLAGEVVVVDLSRSSVASLGIASDGIGYVGFAGPELLAISTANGLYSVRPGELEYVSF
ncbi:MAG TPA: protein kinase [Kofleriaceae bacterium]